MKTVTLTSKNQITIPAEIVRQLKLDKTRKLVIEVEKDRLVLKRQKDLEEIWADFHTQIKPQIIRPLSDEEIRRARQEAHEERVGRLMKRSGQNWC